MSSGTNDHDRDYAETVFLYALQALPSSEIPTVRLISPGAGRRQEVEALR
jgi:hypothetical protein